MKLLPSTMTSSTSNEESKSLFSLMIKRPLPFLLFFPVIWIIFCGIGWSEDDKIEEEVHNIWAQQRSSYMQDKEYADSLGKNDRSSSAFAALAVSRDGNNLFTKDRLNEIRDRMKDTEDTTISYKGETYSWDDVCLLNDVGLGTTYEFPCTRLSPVDFFQEARWFFDENDRATWYTEIVRKLVIRPRLDRFGILNSVCSNLTTTSDHNECNDIIALRMSQGNPLALFSDIGNMELNDKCRVCIEDEFENTIDFLQSLIVSMFQVLYGELKKAEALGSPTAELQTLLKQTEPLAFTTDRQDIIDFYSYSVLRQLYAELGKDKLVAKYKAFVTSERLTVCLLLGQDCPEEITVEQAWQMLLNHADNSFSNVNTAGNPLPYWSEGDGTGFLFGGNSPFGGSGINLSGTAFSTTVYLDLTHYNKGNWTPLYNGDVADPTSDSMWPVLVETDPVFRWFIAAETNMTAHCGNGNLTGTNFVDKIDNLTALALATVTQRWCTPFDEPSEEQGDQTRTVQHFARMWYDLLVDSPDFLGLTQGESDPYVWTLGQGCGYQLAGERFSYENENQTESAILANASGQLYYIDEGTSVGAIDRNLLIGGTDPPIAELTPDNPLKYVRVIQTIYPSLVPQGIVDRVQNCNRPRGSINITVEDAKEILFRYKEAFENSWTEGWDDEDSSEVKFVGFFDDSGVVGTTGRLLKDITLDNGPLIAVSIIIIAVFSALFLFSFDLVESRALITLLGVGLVILAFFASIGFALMVGIKINITIAWTLPFILLGLGVDDMYIVLIALKKQQGYGKEDFIRALQDVIVPISMTSLVNASMFAIMNISDIPAVYLTAQVALIAIIFLYLTVVLCFPAWCWLDMRRQAQGRYDIVPCKKSETESTEAPKSDSWAAFMYNRFYKPLLLGNRDRVQIFTHACIWIVAGTLLGIGIWGLTEREIGLGLEDFFPVGHQAHDWATLRTEELASWSIQMNWGALDYLDSDTQMQMIKQFEDVVETPNVAQIDTKFLWMADLAIWSSRQCDANFDREDPDKRLCGHDQLYTGDNTTCSATWVPNKYKLREKEFSEGDVCVPFERGICRPSHQMHALDLEDFRISEDDPGAWCPVLEGWSKEKMQFCLGRWREATGGRGQLVLDDQHGTVTECSGEYLADESVRVPIPFSAGPSMFSTGLYSHEITLDMLEDTRSICDYHPDLHCWMTGIPYDYWSQYIGIFNAFLKVGGTSVAVGFGVSALFLLLKLLKEGQHSTAKIVTGSLVGALLIAVTSLLSLVAASGLSVLAGVSLTGFSNMALVLSVGFAVEYSVHIVARWLRADSSIQSSLDRVEHTMNFLFLPTFMSFVSSTIGVACLAFTDFEFNRVYFFRPLIIVMFVTYFYGCWWLPTFLTLLDFDQLKLGGTAAPLVPLEGKSFEAGREKIEPKEEEEEIEVEEEDDDDGDIEVA